MNRAVSLALWAGTLTGVGLCAAATVAHGLDAGFGAHLAKVGVVALLLTPPLRLAVTSAAFLREGDRRHAAAAAAVLCALAYAAVRAGAL